MTFGVVIRFKNSSSTLPAVLAALARQDVQPDVILGIDSGSTDGSGALLAKAGAKVMRWPAPYEHSAVLNAGFAACPTDLVMALSSHSVLRENNAIRLLRDSFSDPTIACASVRHPRFQGAVEWSDLVTLGLTDASFYTNSAGVIRRQLWLENPFHEGVPVCEDHVWAVNRLKAGYRCQLRNCSTDYLRPSPENRWLAHWRMTFGIANHWRLHVNWPGRIGVLSLLAKLSRDVVLQREKLGVVRYRGRQLIAQFVASMSHERERRALAKPMAMPVATMLDHLRPP